MKKINFAFLTMLIPPEQYNEVEINSKNNMQDAANALQWHIYNGLCSNLKQEIKLFNVLPIGSFPQYYKKAIIFKKKFKTPYCSNNLSIGFCNVKLVRQYHQAYCLTEEIKKWCQENTGEKILFVYTISSVFMTVIVNIKNIYPNIKICAFVADLPNMASLSSHKSLIKKLYIKYISHNSYNSLGSVDYFVLLTKQMAEYMKITQPFCIMEGIATNRPFQPIVDTAENQKKIILYTGTLHKKFGILNLLAAFKKIKKPNYELIICGVGDSEKEISLAVQEDNRIRFLGKVSRKYALQLQENATALVNPRQNNEEFTKYSFPSKNMEYLSSGRPLIAYKLDGIPDEYKNYIFYVDDNTIDALTKKIIEVCEMPGDILRSHCERAYNFVMTQKNEVEQTKKVVQLLHLT